ncbi:hypothetical protein DPMN_055063 [Dreissena polymorpha]|uniref:Uncharacterized protein n=1 Tax=Dreissena polymorpha TaxID=45954 RepID=A0A9D4HS69_DREPO|nr:hypothetical protein DPMN_055063 [Dreissena polymorpha]
MANNAKEDMQQEPDVTNKTKYWIEILGAKLDSILERTHGKRKAIIEDFFRMPLVIMVFAWWMLGPYSDNILLEIPCLLLRFLGMRIWMEHAQTGFQIMLPVYVDAVLCFTSAWLCRAIYWTLQAQKEAAYFLDEFGIAFSDTRPNRKITFISALVVRSLLVHRFVNKPTQAFWANITLTVITLLSISTQWYFFMQLDYWSMQYFYWVFMVVRCEVCSKAEIERLNALKKATNIEMRSTTDEPSRRVCLKKLQAYSMLITMHANHQLSWKAVSNIRHLVIIFGIVTTAIDNLEVLEHGFIYYVGRNIYCCAVLVFQYNLGRLVGRIIFQN